MAIIQISKLQQRSGNIVDLPQLDEAEFGWATDAKRLFIGKESPNENIEVLTSYSNISFDQVLGAVGNLDIDSVTIEDGQVLTYDGTNWVNRGGNAGGLIDLGSVSNVRITGGAIGYVLETDGTGNLSWTPKSTIIAFIKNATQANPCVITTTEDNFFTEAQEVTITNVTGMTQLNGNSYYANVISSNSFALYTDLALTTPVNSSGYGAFPYTSVSATNSTTDRVTVGSSSAFSNNDPIEFVGTMTGTGLSEETAYFVYDKPTGTTIRVSTSGDGNVSNVVQLTTNGSVTANVYVTGGRIIAAVAGSGGSGSAGGSNTTIQFNNSSLLDGSANLTFDFANNILSLAGNANVSNLNSTTLVVASRFTSNVSTGTAPLTVTSTTRVSNLNVSYSNVSDFEVVTTQTTGTFYPVFVNANTTANYALGSNSNISFNAATGNLSTTLLNANGNANVGNLGTSGLITATGNVNAGNFNTAGVANSATLTVSGNANIGNIGTAGLITATGNIRGANLVTGGVLSVTGNANIGNIGTAGLITATGNIQGGNLVTAGLITATGNITGGNLVTGGVLSVTGNANIGNIGTAGLITATGNITGGNLVTGGVLSVTGNANIGNIGTAGLIIATGNITGGNLLGPHANGNSNVNIPAANGNVNISAIGNANILVITGTGVNVSGTLNATGNANVGNLGTAGLITVTGNIVAGNVYANSGTIGASLLTGTLTTAAQPNVTSVSTSFTNLTFANAQIITGNNLTLTTGANTNLGTITGNWSLSAGSRLQATYADLAEYYSSDENYGPGTVLEFGGNAEVTMAEDGSKKVAGVVSTNPAYVMNTSCPGKYVVALALQGRTPVKVRGKISKGDMLISGGGGYARPTTTPQIGTIIGKALENFDGIQGVIEIAVGRI